MLSRSGRSSGVLPTPQGPAKSLIRSSCGPESPCPDAESELLEVDYSALYVFHSLKAPVSG